MSVCVCVYTYCLMLICLQVPESGFLDMVCTCFLTALGGSETPAIWPKWTFGLFLDVSKYPNSKKIGPVGQIRATPI